MLSLEEGHLAASRLLLESKADVTRRDENGFTAQDRCEPRIKVEIVELMAMSASARTRKEQCASSISAGSTDTSVENLSSMNPIDKEVDISETHAVLERAAQKYGMLPTTFIQEGVTN